MSSVRESRQTPPAATGGVWPARDDKGDPYYWKREPFAYVSGANAVFGVPQVRACVERVDGSVAASSASTSVCTT